MRICLMLAIGCLFACKPVVVEKKQEATVFQKMPVDVIGDPSSTATWDRWQSLPIPIQQQSVMDRAHTALVLVAGKSVDARKLLGFFDEHARPAQMVGEEFLQPYVPWSTEQDFFLIAAEEPSQTEGGNAIQAEFMCRTRTMVLRPSSSGDLALGLILMHEIAHAIDCLVLKEPPSDSMSMIWLEGEMRAFQSTSTMLEQWSSGKWHKAVLASAGNREQLAREQGDVRLLVTANLTTDRPRIQEALGGGVLESDMSTFLTQMTVEAGLQRAAHAAKEGSGDLARRVRNGQLGFMYQYYLPQFNRSENIPAFVPTP